MFTFLVKEERLPGDRYGSRYNTERERETGQNGILGGGNVSSSRRNITRALLIVKDRVTIKRDYMRDDDIRGTISGV